MPRKKKKKNVVYTDILPPKSSWRYLFLKLTIGVMVGALLCSAILLVTVMITIHQYLTIFSTSAQIAPSQLIQSIKIGLQTQPTNSEGRKNILLLGTDSTKNRIGEKILTDTIMLLSLDLDSGQLYAISFPRDLWIDEYFSKLNGLYQIGIDQALDDPESLTTVVIEQLTDIEIHHTIIINLESVADVIDALGGVVINIPESFVDHQYPRSDVDITTERDPLKLYESVEFVQGQERMDGQRALQYIRSRKSLNPNQGSDDARVRRQQQVIGALIQEVSNLQLVSQPAKLGQLYKLYRNNFEQSISTSELIATARNIGPQLQDIVFQPTSLSIEQLAQPGVIFHPQEDKLRGWIYDIRSLSDFQTEVHKKLGLL